MSYWWEPIEWESAVAEEPTLSDSPSEDRQPIAGLHRLQGCVGGVGIILAAQSRVPAAPSGSQRHRQDSVDNEQSLWCVLQGLAKAEPENSNEAQASV